MSESTTLYKSQSVRAKTNECQSHEATEQGVSMKRRHVCTNKIKKDKTNSETDQIFAAVVETDQPFNPEKPIFSG